MRIAIFSDVHGNLSGLEAVLADIDRRAADLVVFAGDLCLMGPHPAETLRLVRERRLPSVVGNTDGFITSGVTPPEKFGSVIEWTRSQLSPEESDWLARLPFSLQISPAEGTAGRLLIVHANPFNVNDILYPPEDFQIGRYGEVHQSDAELASTLAGVEAAVLAFGHLHIPNIRSVGSMTLVNVSSVNMPGDGDGRAKYAMLEWNGETWTATHHRVEYDATAEREAFIARRPPGWEGAVASLDEQGYYYPQRI